MEQTAKSIEKGKAEAKPEEQRWSDQLEAIQYTTRVFALIHEQIGTDIVLAKLEPDQREFIIEQVKQAFALERQLPDKGVANRVFTTIIVETLMRSILNRNVDKNTLLEIIGGQFRREEEEGDLSHVTERKLYQRIGDGLKNMMGRGEETP